MQDTEKALVPALVGLTVVEAARLAATAGVTIEPVLGRPAPQAVIEAQQPLAGFAVEPGSVVQVTIDESGGGGGSALEPPPLVPDGPNGAGEPTGA